MLTVIPYRIDQHDGLELRYAIRSLYKYFKDFSEVLLIGDKPSWYRGDFLAMDDVDGRREYSIYRKLVAYGGTCLYTNDDFFALKPFDKFIPNYYNGSIHGLKSYDAEYQQLIANCPPDWLNFDVHTPMVIDTRKFPEWQLDRPIKSTYGNLNELEGEQLTDLKIRGHNTYEQIRSLIKERPFFSTHENSMNQDMRRVLNELYPVPSPNEAT